MAGDEYRNALAGSTLAEVLSGDALYGRNYVDPRIGSDSVDFDTRNVSAAMANRTAAEEREPYEALTRLLTTWGLPAAAVAHRALVGPTGNSWKAIERHIDLERRMKGNPLVNSATTPFLQAYLAAQPAVGGSRLPGFGRPATPLQAHADNTADILFHLNRIEPKTKTLY